MNINKKYQKAIRKFFPTRKLVQRDYLIDKLKIKPFDNLKYLVVKNRPPKEKKNGMENDKDDKNL